MANTEWTPAVWQDEQALIKIAAARYGVDWHFVAAIRKAEEGGPGREFGVLSVKAPSYAAQLEVCCQTVRHRLVEYDGDNPALELHQVPDGKQAVAYPRDFIAWFRAIWAPHGVANHPTRLNPNSSSNAGSLDPHLI